MSEDQVEKNKAIVAKLFEVIYGDGGNIDEILDEYVAEDYIQHNPHAGQGREGVRRFFKEQLVPLPYRHEPRQETYIAEGEYVVRQEIRNHQYKGMLVDIFRVKDGLVVEHWDAYRPDPGTEPMPALTS
jgi:predicted SnoaL-like aldol condensation-catalyzing enzyme